MKRYFVLFYRLVRYSLIRDLEFRFNLVAWSLANILWAFMLIVLVDLIFGQADTIAGWTRDETRILVVTYTIFAALFWVFVLPSLGNFGRFIRNGELDSYMHMPVNLRFLITFNRFEFDQIIRLVLTSFLLVSFIIRVNPSISLFSWFSGIALLLLGLVLFYNVYFFLITLNFWMTNLTNMEWLTEVLVEFGRFPVEIFKGSLKIVFTFIIPVAFVASFPVKAWLGRDATRELLMGLLLAFVSFMLTQAFWNFALKRYSSASS